MRTRDQVLVLRDIIKLEVARLSDATNRETPSDIVALHQYRGVARALDWVLDPAIKLKVEDAQHVR